MLGKLEIVAGDLTKQSVDCIVNAAQSDLEKGKGVCGAVFDAAGEEQLTDACRKIGHCHTGDVVVTPAFNLDARYIIHAVGPRWVNGNIGEADRLYNCYQSALEECKQLGCNTIAFPLISSGIFGFPVEVAWQTAIQSVTDYQLQHENYPIDVRMVNLSSEITAIGQKTLQVLRPEQTADSFVFFWKENEENGFLATRYRSDITYEGLSYHSAEQYYMAKKALMFEDIKQYFLIMSETDPKRCKAHGQAIQGYNEDIWSTCREEVAFNANLLKFQQNPELRDALLATGDKILAFANPHDVNWGIALKQDDENALVPGLWKGRNLQGIILMKVREYFREQQK